MGGGFGQGNRYASDRSEWMGEIFGSRLDEKDWNATSLGERDFVWSNTVTFWIECGIGSIGLSVTLY